MSRASKLFAKSTTVPSISIHHLAKLRACELHERVQILEKKLGRTVDPDEAIPVRTWWDLPTPVEDRWWCLHAFPAGELIAIKACIFVMQRALKTRKTHPSYKLYAGSLRAAEAWLADPSAQEMRRVRNWYDRLNDARVVANAALAAYPTDYWENRLFANGLESLWDAESAAAPCCAYYAHSLDDMTTLYTGPEVALQMADLDRLLAEATP